MQVSYREKNFMTMRLVQRLAKALYLGNGLLALGFLALVIAGIAAPKPPIEMPIPLQTPPQRSEERFTVEMLRPCHEILLLEDAPKTDDLPKPPLPQPAQPKETPVKPPYQWVGVCVHSVPQKSFAMLMDERTGQQVMVCQGGLIPGTSFEVVEITRNSVKIRMSAAIGIVERPKPEKIGKPESKALLESISKNSLTIEKNKVMVGAAPGLFKYGLQTQDQIVAVDGKRIYNLTQLEEAVSGTERSLADVSVLRQGRIMSIVLPKEAVSQVITPGK
jgi:hypothetical protein